MNGVTDCGSHLNELTNHRSIRLSVFAVNRSTAQPLNRSTAFQKDDPKVR
jgi:hypothetical protein